MSVGELRAVPVGAVRDERARGGVAMPSWSRAAWAAIGVTLLFVALTCWWLSQNRAMPYGDAAINLAITFLYHDQLSHGDLLAPFTSHFIYPPLTPFVGTLGIFVGGRTMAAPILIENLVYVPLLALGCYRTAQRAFGPPAGLLAVVFALGVPLIAEQFHVFMFDAPLAALVAVTVWLVIESDRFRRVDVALAAGVAAGIGMMSKQSFPLYLAGLVVVVLVRGGWRNARGVAAGALGLLVVALPWYAYHHGGLSEFANLASANESVPPLAQPPLLSTANLGWYVWALANALLFVPLLAFATVGVVQAAVETARHRTPSGVVPDLLGGLAGAWLAITVMPHHDLRYTMPLTVYLAVLGTGWIVRARPPVRAVATVALVLAALASTVGMTFGIGPSRATVLPANRAYPRGIGVPPLNHLTFYSNTDYMVSGPRRGGDILGLLKAMRAEGVREIGWVPASAPLWFVDFNHHGLTTFAEMAQLHLPKAIDPEDLLPNQVFLLFGSLPGPAQPCVQLRRDAGIWARRWDPQTRRIRYYCPRLQPHFYDS